MKVFVLLYLFSFVSVVYSLPLPLSSSLGDSGRAGYGSADYHILNAASILHGKMYQTSGMYFFKGKEKIYGGSLTNSKDIPIGFTWMRLSPTNNYQVFSIAGRLSKKFLIGIGIHRHSEHNEIFSSFGHSL